MTHTNPFPSARSKAHKLLSALLNGERCDPFWGLAELNLPTMHARVSELRKVGWPIRSVQLPHPKLAGEHIVAYILDTHFRAWYLGQHSKTGAYPHPATYPGQEGRGKFAEGGHGS